MRIHLILAAALALVTQPALAGERAVYLDADGKALTISITDDGNAVVRGEGDQDYGVMRDGTFYMVSREDGKWHVARMTDMAAAFGKVLPPVFKEIFDLASKDRLQSKLRIEPAGNRTVGGIAGQAYRIYGLDEEKPKQASINVLTRDPKLQATGRAMEQFLVGSMMAFVPLLGETAGEMASDIRAIFALGAPLELEGKFKLKSFETVAIPASEAVLPAKPDTIDQIAASMRKSGMAGDAKAK